MTRHRIHGWPRAVLNTAIVIGALLRNLVPRRR